MTSPIPEPTGAPEPSEADKLLLSIEKCLFDVSPDKSCRCIEKINSHVASAVAQDRSLRAEEMVKLNAEIERLEGRLIRAQNDDLKDHEEMEGLRRENERLKHEIATDSWPAESKTE
jgi:hypothetical protein